MVGSGGSRATGPKPARASPRSVGATGECCVCGAAGTLAGRVRGGDDRQQRSRARHSDGQSDGRGRALCSPDVGFALLDFAHQPMGQPHGPLNF